MLIEYILKIYACTFMLFPSGSRAEPADFMSLKQISVVQTR